MRVPVVNVRKVRVAVFQRLMLMQMGVRLGAIPTGFVAVLVVGIVAVRVLVRQRGMLMGVGVVFCQVQPDPRGHQARSRPENHAG